MVHEVDSQAEAGLEPRLKTDVFELKPAVKTERLTVQVHRRSVYLFIYLFILLLLLLLIFYQLFFFLWGRLFVTPLLITSYCVEHNPSSFLFVLSK